MPEKLPDVDLLLELFERHNIRYVLIGGMAMIAQGCSHLTFDIDFAIARSKENVAHIVEALRPYTPRPKGLDPALPFFWDETSVGNSSVLVLETTIGGVDLLTEPSGVDSFEGLYERATTLSIGGHDVKVASLLDLLNMKKAADRPKDRLHIMEIEALIRMLREQGSGDPPND